MDEREISKFVCPRLNESYENYMKRVKEKQIENGEIVE